MSFSEKQILSYSAAEGFLGLGVFYLHNVLTSLIYDYKKTASVKCCPVSAVVTKLSLTVPLNSQLCPKSGPGASPGSLMCFL